MSSLPTTDNGMFLRDGLLALGFDEDAANERILAIEAEAAQPAALDVDAMV